MSWATLGTLALPFHLQRTGVQARTDLARSSHELTTGRVQSAARHLRGDLGALHAIENRLTRITGFETALKQTVTAFDAAQSALDRVAQNGQGLAEKLVMATQSGTGPSVRAVAATAARNVLEETISALSTTVAGRALFSGVLSDRGPLPGVDAFLAELAPQVAGLTTAADVITALEDYFTDPNAGFSTDIYRGGPARPGGVIDDGDPAAALPTADEPALRSLMMHAAMVVLIDNGAVTLSSGEERLVHSRAMTGLLENATDMAALQARVGVAQEAFEQRQTRLSVERDRLEMARSDKIGVDPYKAAMAVEQSRVQLESIYTVTARIARLSLTEYLR